MRQAYQQVTVTKQIESIEELIPTRYSDETDQIDGRTGTVQMKQAKADMVASSWMLQNKLLLNDTPRVIGHIPGVIPGAVFNGKAELRALGIHNCILSGIDSVKTEIGFGELRRSVQLCTAVALSGSYKDDDDSGATLWYTGEGGLKSKRDQVLTKVCRC